MPPEAETVIVGAACRFPGGAGDLDSYWRLLLAGRAVAADPDPSRAELWRAAADPDLGPRITTLKGGYLDDISGFDADYFGISPREAVKIDPQHRLFLEVAHDAIEDAGLTRADLARASVGVFAGAGSTDYMTIDAARKGAIDGYHGLGNSHSLIANRLSYHYDLKGPSLTIDTACSSSLTALHQARRAVLGGEVDLAIVGGVNVIVSPDLTLAFSQARMLSPGGRCRTFAAGADGYGRAEGAGVAVLMRRERAQAEGRRIRCGLRASAINSDGRSNGITAPNGRRQVEVIRAALAAAGAVPADLAYIEAHGTGTVLGDAIEIEALRSLFAGEAAARCFVGSAKANLGHMEAAAGMGGLLKAMLMLERGTIPPHPMEGPPSEAFRRAGQVLHLCEAPRPLDRARALIGVSSFGFGGSNAHVILEAAPAEAAAERPKDARPVLLTLSSHHAEALAADAATLAEFAAGTASRPADLALSLNVGRDPLPFRRALVAGNSEGLSSGLAALASAPPPERVAGKPPLAFVFTGQGAQIAGMGRWLFERNPCFREAFLRCDEAIASAAGFSIAARLYGARAAAEAALTEDTHLAQVSLFAFEYALAEFWISLGICPDFAIGHSLGELVAHTVAGGLALPEAARLVHERGRLMQAEGGDGAMLALALAEEKTAAAIAASGLALHIAAVNASASTVVSGATAAISAFEAFLKHREIAFRRLKVRHAFHSPDFAGAARSLNRFAASLPTAAGKFPVASNLDGNLCRASDLGADYWGRQILQPVRFADGVAKLIEQGVRLFLEIGPAAVLSPLIRRDHAESGIRALAGTGPGDEENRILLETLGTLFEQGCDVSLTPLLGQGSGPRMALPPRHLVRRPYWTEALARPAPECGANRDADGVAPGDPLAELIERQTRVMASQLALLHPSSASRGSVPQNHVLLAEGACR